MLKKFKIELEICGPAHATMEDVAAFIEDLTSNKDVSEQADIFAIGDYDIYDEGEISLEEWNGEEVSVAASEE